MNISNIQGQEGREEKGRNFGKEGGRCVFSTSDTKKGGALSPGEKIFRPKSKGGKGEERRRLNPSISKGKFRRTEGQVG